MKFPSSAYPEGRPRRLRATSGIRSLVEETTLLPTDMIQPYFVHDGPGPSVPISSMPGQLRLNVTDLIAAAKRTYAAGVPAIALFPKVNDALKSETGEAAWDPSGLVPKVVRRLKVEVPHLLIITDVALDPYSSLGQDGIVVDGDLHNDLTIEALVKQAICQAEAGADIVAPSDMMDGRVGQIRKGLDAAGFNHTSILAYSAKYASVFYGPFRDALDSAPRGGADKKTYQMNPANTDEALHEVALDISEGADMVMVKPGMPYLDVLFRVKDTFKRPTAVYQVSGEYAMIKAAGQNGWLDERQAILESLLCFKRAGADMILTYFATEVAEWLNA